MGKEVAMNILKSEKLKIKNSRMLLISIVIAILCGVFALFFGGTLNILHQSIYWWMGVFLVALLQIVAYRNLSIEKKATDFFNIKTAPQNRGKIYIAKIILNLYYGFLGTITMGFITSFFKWSMPHNGLINSNLSIVLGMSVIYITNIWIVPLFFIISKKINSIILILLNFLLSFFIAPFVAGSKLFILLPHCYAFKPAKVFFSIKEAGDILTRPIILMDKIEMIIAIMLSLMLFVLFSFLLYRRENKNA